RQTRHGIHQERGQPTSATSHESRVTSSNTCHTTPKSAPTGPANASPRETHAAPADKPPPLPPPHTASARDRALGSAPTDQPYPRPPAAPTSVSSPSSNAQTANCSGILPAAPTEPRKNTHPPPDDPRSQIPKSNSPSPLRIPPP